ncbi:hypothetical protein PGTUg99_004938 [Puccinia graminis f. sp. tritici]|uniref:Uncharacterized protein n=1 Tax=Puccinia graminis f. sp. tritici TaxID=56615 RepID=A0A5B0N5M0_PUCGR|nr:hypothetical protein PGTUg99_004938 [Puccinia graminis f. sp. tritici]
MQVPSTRAPRVPMKEKLDSICALISKLNLTLKSFLVAFLEEDQDSMAFKRRMWGSTDRWDSTVGLILAIKRLTHRHLEGRGLWEEFILSQAIEIVSSEKPRSGVAPNGSYYTSATLTEGFFSKEQITARHEELTRRMPFLYNLLCAKIQGNKGEPVGMGPTAGKADPVEDRSDDEEMADSSDEMPDFDGTLLHRPRDRSSRRSNRVKTVG